MKDTQVRVLAYATIQVQFRRGVGEEGSYGRRGTGKFPMVPLRMSTKHLSRKVRMSLWSKHILQLVSVRMYIKIIRNTPQSWPLQNHYHYRSVSVGICWTERIPYLQVEVRHELVLLRAIHVHKFPCESIGVNVSFHNYQCNGHFLHSEQRWLEENRGRGSDGEWWRQLIWSAR